VITQPQEIPLIERKKARIKLALLDTAVELMRIKSFSEITVEELCQITEISKGTFFSYFPRKSDLIVFYIRLWSIEAVWAAKHEYGASAGLKLIEATFIWTGKLFEDHPKLLREIIALRAFEPETFTNLAQDGAILIGPAERLLRFPGKEGIEKIPEGNFVKIILENLRFAIERGELPAKTDVEQVLLALMSTFYGIPLMLGNDIPNRLSKAYSAQLKVLKEGFGSQTKG
jgi:AcrR family transcriptional regulator